MYMWFMRAFCGALLRGGLVVRGRALLAQCGLYCAVRALLRGAGFIRALLRGAGFILRSAGRALLHSASGGLYWNFRL